MEPTQNSDLCETYGVRRQSMVGVLLGKSGRRSLLLFCVSDIGNAPGRSLRDGTQNNTNGAKEEIETIETRSEQLNQSRRVL